MTSTMHMNIEEGYQAPPTLASIQASRGWWPLPQVKLASWDPENEKQWKSQGGKGIAWRNMIVSMFNLFCGFGVWLSWSIIVVQMQRMHDKDPTVYAFAGQGSPMGKDYQFMIASIPATAGLSGGILRINNSFVVPIGGGRTANYVNSLLLMIPMILACDALRNPNVSFDYLLLLAILSGVGGGCFASSMSNMTTFFPKAQQGYSLGLNGGLGNLGVSISQLVLPQVMAWAAGDEPLTETAPEGWPNHAGWFWWPTCLVAAIAAFLWMSDHPDHANHEHAGTSTTKNYVWSHVYYFWLEATGIACAIACSYIFTATRAIDFFKTLGGQIVHRFLIVLVAVAMEHVLLWFATPTTCQRSIRKQARMFQDKHTTIMTILYIMSFGSFIGFSGAFPALIQNLFGYLTVEGCTMEDGDFAPDGTELHCIAMGGTWDQMEVVNPNAPSVFRFAWLGACVGSLIRPVGGKLADWYGGGNCTQLMIVWCFVATVCGGILIEKVYQDKNPEELFPWFVFMFVNLFLTVGAMNGTTFRTIGVLFDKELAGPVLGWSSAIASFGAFVIPSMFQVAVANKSAHTVMYGLAAFYGVCGIVNYYYYVRVGCEKPGV